MLIERTCSECGAEIPSDSRQGLCTRCLFTLGLKAGSELADPPLESEIGNQKSKIEHSKLRYFGDYELLEELGRGGMGAVYKARQVTLNRLVAVKMILPGELASSDLVQRFRTEAEAAASLDHPNIVPIHEIGEHHGQHYFSMGLIDGPNLRQALGQIRNRKSEIRKESEPPHVGCYAPREAARLVATVARAVHYAHQRGVLHRDLKPSNILLDARGEPHLTDFGLAKLVQKESTLTHTNVVMGTPAYMSPEQARGAAKDMTMAADVYGLGAVLYEMLTGSPPFSGGTSMETIRQVLDQEPRRPSTFNPAVDLDLETICLKCLEKDPSRRYATAQALADDLEHRLNHEPILARRATVFDRITKWARRQPVLAATVVLMLLVLALGFAGVLWQWRQAVVARKAESAERRRAELAEADALARLREAKLNYVRANRLTSRPGQRFDSLAELARAAVSSNSLDLRNEAIACLTLPDLRPLRSLAKTPRIDSLRFEASLQHYVTNDSSGGLIIRDTETDAARYQIPHQGAPIIGSLTSPDGRWLATSDRAGQAHLWSLPKPTPRSLEFPTGAVLLAFTPDSRALVVKHGDDSLHFLNATNGADERWVPGAPTLAWPSQFQFNAAGDRFASLAQGKVVVRRMPDGSHPMTLTAPQPSSGEFGSLAWHPDGRRIAATSLNIIGLWDAETGCQIGVFEGHEGPVIGLAFTATGEYLSTTSWDHTTRLWQTATRRNILRLSDAGNFPCISPDSRRLAFQSWDYARAQLYELANPVVQRFDLPPPTRELVRVTEQADYSPDGELVLALDHDGMYVFRPPNPAPVALLPVLKSSGARFTLDGSALLTAGADGVQRWPLRWSPDRSELHFDPPEVVEPTRGIPVSFVDLSQNGQWLVALAQDAVLTLRPTPPFELVRLARNIRLGGLPSISPDGRLVVTITPLHSRIQVWNARTAGLITNLAVKLMYRVAFSPDGKLLAGVEDNAATFWRTADWTVQKLVPGPPDTSNRRFVAFSPDGRIVAVALSGDETRLLKVASGEELATLPTGPSPLMRSIRFSPVGDRLAIAYEPGYFQLWDLRHLREQLAAINLDWDLPPYPPAPTNSALANRPLRVMVHALAPPQ